MDLLNPPKEVEALRSRSTSTRVFAKAVATTVNRKATADEFAEAIERRSRLGASFLAEISRRHAFMQAVLRRLRDRAAGII